MPQIVPTQEDFDALEARVFALENSTTPPPPPPPPPGPDPDPVEYDYLATPGEVIDLAGASDVRVSWEPGTTVPRIDLGGSRNVVLVGDSELTVRGDSGGPLQSGTVSLWESEAAVVRNLNIPFSPRSAISMEHSAGALIEDIKISDPWHLGIHGGYINGAIIRNVGILGSTQRIADGEGEGVGWEDGGMKLTNAVNLLIEQCYVSGGYGPGIWLDIAVQNSVVRKNVIGNQSAEGVFVEISRNILVQGNKIIASPHSRTSSRMDWMYGGGILVSTSDGVDVLNNLVEDCYNGITVIDQSHRGDTMPDYDAGDYLISENTVRRTKKVGAAQDVGREDVFAGVWEANTFESVEQFEWNSSQPSPF